MIMDLSQHSDEDVRRVYEYVRRLGRWGEMVVQGCGNLTSDKESLVHAIRYRYPVFFTQREAERIATYILACRDVELVIARLQGGQRPKTVLAAADQDEMPF
jgi:hypothetical protein